MIRSLLAAAAVAALLAVPPAWAGDPTSEDIVNQLAAPPAGPKKPRMRGLSFEEPAGQPAAAAAPASIDLTINFDFASARLLPDGEVLAGNLGRALKDPRLAGNRFRIEGHTDAKGSVAGNRKLSEARANSVRDLLVKRYGVDPRTLDVVGMGASQLANQADPFAGVNRRVRVTNLGRM